MAQFSGLWLHFSISLGPRVLDWQRFFFIIERPASAPQEALQFKIIFSHPSKCFPQQTSHRRLIEYRVGSVRMFPGNSLPEEGEFDPAAAELIFAGITEPVALLKNHNRFEGNLDGMKAPGVSFWMRAGSMNAKAEDAAEVVTPASEAMFAIISPPSMF